MALKMLCQLLVALCVVGYANAVSSGKAVRPRLSFHRESYHFTCIFWCSQEPFAPVWPKCRGGCCSGPCRQQSPILLSFTQIAPNFPSGS